MKMAEQQIGAINEMTPLFSLEYSREAYIRTILLNVWILLCLTLMSVAALMCGYEDIMREGGVLNILSLSPFVLVRHLILILSGVIILLLGIPLAIRNILIIGDIYFFEDSISVRRFFSKKVKHLQYADIEFHRLVNWKWRMSILISLDEKYTLLALYKLITERSRIIVNGKADAERLSSFLSPKGIGIVEDNCPNFLNAFFGIPK
jgi:hypothetical protein